MNISSVITTVQILISLIIFGGLSYFGLQISPKRIVLHAYEAICMKARKEKRSWWDYEKWDDFLTANGAVFH